ncbi:hypothetical protein ABB37_00418 [Leptomonas pyrrhocoris]|uniref:Uncharacterized protein n=1 Tax=Leptomonas pyrrhocoris TaxID=157538 RepID=A0A0M9GAI9_LEPPY|nr:hypothetical protein ABB37_00418 [Leptomonas pyrrhocoris]KPA86169.1 hypothetical protein ABB37_00418 [Leptomonas pyrrhocoris]|eukprot:XP_015664608.1 hypothetical protein ABB37_00418 [Leptomonas pyrrhocoris]
MPTATPFLPPLSPRFNGMAAQPVDDIKLQFAMEEVRKRFSTVSTSEMLEVLHLLLTDKRILQCEEASNSARLDGKAPQDGNAELNGVPEQHRKTPRTLAQLQSSANSSVTASELSPRDWGSMVLENSEGTLHGSLLVSRLNREWKSTITLLLDNARQFRQPDNENHTVAQLVQASITEWFIRTGGAASHPPELPTDVRRGRPDAEVWLSTMAKVRRLAEDACYQKYELQYTQLQKEAENDNEDGTSAAVHTPYDDDSAMSPPSGMARRSTHRSTTAAGNVGIPPFSLVIQCSGPPKRVAATTPDVADAKVDGQTNAEEEVEANGSTTCLVIGCEWFQWVFLVQCPVACQSEPYPVLGDSSTAAEATAARLAQRRWRRRHCTVQLLYPSEAGFSASPDSASDLRSADAEYELSEPQVVLSSLLGVAMRVWCQSQPHLVAEVFQLEEDTYPQHLYDGTSFWSMWPIRDLNTWQQCESASSSDSMPIPLLPGECFAHDSDLDEDDEDEGSEHAD